MKRHRTLRKVAAAALFGALAVPAVAPAQNSADPLEQGFLSPPSSARPRVWWHWMSGNITEEGIGLDFAEVTVNGKALGIVWKAPYRLEVTSAMKPGQNKLEIRVANLWVNRLIGDAQPNAAKKYTFTTHNPYKANSPRVPSGLLGSAQVIRVSSQQP